VECPNPAERDENGNLPYNMELRAADERKKRSFGDGVGQGGSFAEKKSNAASGRDMMAGGPDSKLLNNQSRTMCPSGQQSLDSSDKDEDKETFCNRRSQNITATTEPNFVKDAKNVDMETSASCLGKKRKPEMKSREDLINGAWCNEVTLGTDPMEMAIVVAQSTKAQIINEVEFEGEEIEMIKRQRNEENTSVILSAEAGYQPRQEP
jgi:hypothetical protein